MIVAHLGVGAGPAPTYSQLAVGDADPVAPRRRVLDARRTIAMRDAGNSLNRPS
jgi:hypothetical protein